MSTVLVTGATGILGPKVVQHLLHCQHHVRTYARQSPPSLPQGVEVYQGDIRVGSGLIEATRGVDAIIHCATFADDGGVTDIQGSRHLVEAALANGSPHMSYISIIKIEQSPFPYFKAKLEVEHMIEQSGLLWTIVRATSFHEFVLRLLTSAENKEASTITLPAGAGFQSIDANEVAHILAHLPEQQPAGFCGHFIKE